MNKIDINSGHTTEFSMCVCGGGGGAKLYPKVCKRQSVDQLAVEYSKHSKWAFGVG